MILFLHGEDRFLVQRRKNILHSSFRKKYPDGEIFVFDFEDQKETNIMQRSLSVCETGLFSKKKLVFFLHPSAINNEQEKYLQDFLQDFSVRKSDDITVCFVEPGKIKKTDAITKMLLAYQDTEEVFSKKGIQEREKYVEETLRSFDASAHFTREALTIFLNLLGDDTARIYSELEKLTSYKPGGIFQKEDVFLFVSGTAEEVIFEALDALGNGERGRAIFLFHKKGVDKENIYPIFGICAGQVRRMLLIRELIDKGVYQSAYISTQTKIHPFAVQKIQNIIKNFSLERLKKGLALLSDLDIAIKKGEKDPLIALDVFLWKF